MKEMYKVVVVGLGYVGLSNAVLLAQQNEVVGVDVSQKRVDAVNARQSPFADAELSKYFALKDLNLTASKNLEEAVIDADFVMVCTPTDYDEKTNYFDTTSVEQVIAEVAALNLDICIVVRSTIPVGFIDSMRKVYNTNAILFSPEFLREGKALHDNLYPSRIVVGDKSRRAEIFAGLLAQGSIKKDIQFLFTETRLRA